VKKPPSPYRVLKLKKSATAAEVRGRIDGLAADEAAHAKALELLAAYTFRHAARAGRGVTFGAATTMFAWEA
jgi:hypothetical protein